MRYFSLLKKELRESMVWFAIAGAVLSLSVALVIKVSFPNFERYHATRPGFYKDLFPYGFLNFSSVSDFGPTLLFTSIGLGIVLGVQQFWVPGISRLWPFTVHRSYSRLAILFTKFTAALAGFAIVLAFWTGLFLYARQPGLLAYPPVTRTYFEGCIMIMVGLMYYFASSQTGISRARWYTTRVFPIIFAFILNIFSLCHSSLLVSLAIISIATLIIACQFVYDFLNMEF